MVFAVVVLMCGRSLLRSQVKSSQVKQTVLSHIEKLHCGLLKRIQIHVYRNTWAGIKQQSKDIELTNKSS